MSVSLSTSWVATESSHTLIWDVDPSPYSCDDPNRNNNQAILRFSIGTSSSSFDASGYGLFLIALLIVLVIVIAVLAFWKRKQARALVIQYAVLSSLFILDALLLSLILTNWIPSATSWIRDNIAVIGVIVATLNVAISLWGYRMRRT
jgi:glucose-6-phosphate-specific signal transduction histidine kinase